MVHRVLRPRDDTVEDLLTKVIPLEPLLIEFLEDHAALPVGVAVVGVQGPARAEEGGGEGLLGEAVEFVDLGEDALVLQLHLHRGELVFVEEAQLGVGAAALHVRAVQVVRTGPVHLLEVVLELGLLVAAGGAGRGFGGFAGRLAALPVEVVDLVGQGQQSLEWRHAEGRDVEAEQRPLTAAADHAAGVARSRTYAVFALELQTLLSEDVGVDHEEHLLRAGVLGTGGGAATRLFDPPHAEGPGADHEELSGELPLLEDHAVPHVLPPLEESEEGLELLRLHLGEEGQPPQLVGLPTLLLLLPPPANLLHSVAVDGQHEAAGGDGELGLRLVQQQRLAGAVRAGVCREAAVQHVQPVQVVVAETRLATQVHPAQEGAPALLAVALLDGGVEGLGGEQLVQQHLLLLTLGRGYVGALVLRL